MGIVILDMKDYESEVTQQLNDVGSYKRIPKDPTSSIMNLIKVIVQVALSLDYINKVLCDILIQEHPRVPIFYLLPKVHKPGFPPMGRPTVAAQGSALENISR